MPNLQLKHQIKEDTLTYIIKWEEGTATDREILYLFEELANSGMVFRLQGSYGRNTEHFFRCGYFEIEGTEELEREIGDASFEQSIPLSTHVENWKRGHLTDQENYLLLKKLIETRHIYTLNETDKNIACCVMRALNSKVIKFIANEEFLKSVEGQGKK